METTRVSRTLEEATETLTLQQSQSTEAATTGRPTPEVAPSKVEQKAENHEEMDEVAQEIAENMNKVASVLNTSLVFSVDKPTGKTVIRVVDSETEKIIRQIPPEEMLRLMQKIRWIMGMLLDVEI